MSVKIALAMAALSLTLNLVLSFLLVEQEGRIDELVALQQTDTTSPGRKGASSDALDDYARANDAKLLAMEAELGALRRRVQERGVPPLPSSHDLSPQGEEELLLAANGSPLQREIATALANEDTPLRQSLRGVLREEQERLREERREERRERMMQEFEAQFDLFAAENDLSLAQRQQVFPTLKEEREQISALMGARRDGEMSRAEILAQITTIRAETDAKVASSLDATQRASYEAMRQEEQSRFSRGGRNGRNGNQRSETAR